MLNKYPMWKNLMVVFIIAVGALYALPNLFGEDNAVQISGSRGYTVTTETMEQVKQALDVAQIDVKRLELKDDTLEVRVFDGDQQLKAREVIGEQLGKNFVVAMNLAPSTPQWLEAIGGGPMKLGLDLRGGIHFLMEVDMAEAIAKAQTQMATDFRSDLRSEKIRYSGIRAVGDSVQIKFRNAEALDKAEKFISSRYNEYEIVSGGEAQTLRVRMTEEHLKQIREEAVSQNITIIRNRVNELGVAEPVVQRQGAERIVVQLPGVQDPTRAKEILGATATLEFRMQDTRTDPRDAAAGRLPASSELFDRRGGGQAVLVKDIILTGDHVTGARAAFDENGQPQVSIDLDAQGGDKMASATKDAIGMPMATLFTEYKPTEEVDENGRPKLEKIQEVVSIATIQSRLGRSFRITGVGHAEAQNLALLLRAGALKAPVQIVEERTIGPSLGQQNIENGLQAMIWGLAFVVLFMAIYYRSFGLISVCALAVNLIMVVGVMSMIPGATLTLPGIAGIVLTVGMAVDGNVLIFERIREELRAGRSVQQAIHEGYGNALSTIADANITTFITSLILFAVGTGAVKGFAVTLMIGIATSMFTAIVGSRALVNLIWGGKRVKKLSI
ncbi:protein translocase subunit SecD [Paraferrimonas sedimenticola]|uniref:Protein translocase subunit SecD n=1 Tax=Paraferrimonas sedimenticola TaxID=375674 RepID=A0AA37RRV1_9GAMM|nr:protein translocase subunit SecD [Paraferrimonas sedimenticola]GLP95198.1 protein translocase subunit SecD [Paraferrimonas sedimenticola]